MATGIILYGNGTLASVVTLRVKREVLKNLETARSFKALVEDSAWDDPIFSEVFNGEHLLQGREKIDIGNVPLQDIRNNPTVYGRFTEQLLLDQLNVGVSNLERGGPLIPATAFASSLFHQPQAEEKFLAQLHELLTLGSSLEGLEIWCIGSISSTTGRATLLERLFLARNILEQNGVTDALVNAVVLDSEGLQPDRRDERQRIEAGAWREFERTAEEYPIPRPHDGDWHGRFPAQFTFRFCGKRGGTELNSVEDLKDYVTEWLVTTLLNRTVHSQIVGERVRAMPQIVSDDGHSFDPKPRFLSTSGIAVVTLPVRSLKAFARPWGAEQVLQGLLGEAPSDCGDLATELQLFYGALSQRLNEGTLMTQANREINRLRKTLQEKSKSNWRNAYHSSRANLDTQFLQAQKDLPALRDSLVGELTGRIEEQIQTLMRSPLGTGGARVVVAYLEHISSQLESLRRRAEEQLIQGTNLDQVHGDVEKILNKLNWVKRKSQLEKIVEELRKGYADALRKLIADQILRLNEELTTGLNDQKEKAALLVTQLSNALGEAAQAAEDALSYRPSETARVLLKGKEQFEQTIRSIGLLDDNLLNVVKTELLKQKDSATDPLHLAQCSSKELVEAVSSLIAEKGDLGRLEQLSFTDVFKEQFRDVEKQTEVFRWLTTASEPLGGSVDPGYARKVSSSAQPAVVIQKMVLVPAGIEELARQYLERWATGMEDAIRPLDGLHSLVCVQEHHGRPLWAFPYLVRISNQLPSEEAQRARYVVAKWACEWLPELVRHEPMKGWTERDLVVAGVGLNALLERDGVILLPGVKPVPEPLGKTFDECAAIIQQNGYREDLKKALLEALRSGEEDDVRERLREAAEKEVVSATEANDLFERLASERRWLMNAKTPM